MLETFLQVVARVNKASSSNSNVNPCVMPQPINVILIPFTSLNSVFALAAFLRSVAGLVVDTSSGTPTLSIVVRMKSTLTLFKTINYLLLDCCNTCEPCFHQFTGEKLFDVVIHGEVETSGQGTCGLQSCSYERSGSHSNKRWWGL